MNTNETSSNWHDANDLGRLTLITRIWELTEKIHYRKGHWGEDKIMHNVLVWLSDGLLHLTSANLHHLYWLLLPTERISPTLKQGIDISALLSNLFVINTEK